MAVIDATFAVTERKPKKIQACTGFEPLTSAIPVQLSNQLANKPTGNWSFSRFVINRRCAAYDCSALWGNENFGLITSDLQSVNISVRVINVVVLFS